MRINIRKERGKIYYVKRFEDAVSIRRKQVVREHCEKITMLAKKRITRIQECARVGKENPRVECSKTRRERVMREY